MRHEMTNKSLQIIILISGNGSNLQAIIDAISAGKLNAEICAVISDQPDAFGLERAQKANIPTHIIESKEHPDRKAYDEALLKLFDHYKVELIILAGFMRIIGDDLVKQYYGKILNIHPALLPKYRGLNTHARVLEAGDKEHGTTVHFVSEELDAGPNIVHAKLDVHGDDNPESLKKRIQGLEHKLYPEVIQWFAEKRIKLVGDHVELDGSKLPTDGVKSGVGS